MIGHIDHHVRKCLYLILAPDLRILVDPLLRIFKSLRSAHKLKRSVPNFSERSDHLSVHAPDRKQHHDHKHDQQQKENGLIVPFLPVDQSAYIDLDQYDKTIVRSFYRILSEEQASVGIFVST